MLGEGAIIVLDAGQYRLLGRLAGSSYGVLWRAARLHSTAAVALKLVNREQMERAALPQRARWISSAASEIAFLRALQPWDERHIVRLLDSGAHDGLPAMALELLDGNLAQHVAAAREAGRPLPFTRTLDWIAQVNQALAKVHQYGWRYLDLKPSNLLIDARDDSLKLADFGTNRLLGDRQPHTYAGTASWQAPEQFFPNATQAYDTDSRTDYFALGALFYYLVTNGQALRFCSACGDAYREHGSAGAAMLLQRHGGTPPPALAADEAARFVQCIDQSAPDGAERTWCPPGAAPAGAAALSLLRALLAERRDQRPAHALDISRMIAQVRAALEHPGHTALRSAA